MHLIHPVLRIAALFGLAVLIQLLPVAALMGAGIALMLVAYTCYRPVCRTTLRRSRWLLVTLLLIYSLSTPGEYVPGWPVWFAPTYEGLMTGALQTLRLLSMLAGLVLLLGSTPREELMAAIYQLLRPLRWTGVSPQRFSARLWLTLEYLEDPKFRRLAGSTMWATWFQDDGVMLGKEKIAIEVVPFSPVDWAMLGVGVLAVCGVAWAL